MEFSRIKFDGVLGVIVNYTIHVEPHVRLASLAKVDRFRLEVQQGLIIID